MNYYAACFLLAVAATQLATCDCCRAQEPTRVSPLTIGQTLKFNSTVLNEERTLNVYLPATYRKNAQQKYPVIFLLDGSLDEDFIHIIVSPSLWWDNQSLLKSNLPVYEQPASIFIGVGKEGEVMERLAKKLSEKIESARHEKLKASFEKFPGLDHGDTLHLAVYKAFDIIFSQSGNEK